MIMENSTAINIDLNIKDHSCGKTAFHFVCDRGHSDVAEMFLKTFSDLNIEWNGEDKYGSTAFHFACMKGHLKVI